MPSLKTFAFALLVLLLGSCVLLPTPGAPLGQDSFARYREETRQWLKQKRAFQLPTREAELEWNSPREWRPAGAPGRGILLVHGLGDSPWSFSDLGPALAQQGYLVRSVLLPGHGTRPEDLMDASFGAWRQLLREQVALLQQEVAEVYLGGFSTGANLVTEYALKEPRIAGLLLFSPAFKSDNPYDWLAPWVAWAHPWLREPDPARPQQSPVRYLNTPTQGFALFYRSSSAVRSELASRPYAKPALLVVAAADSVVDVTYSLETFSQRFTHPASRLIWYGELPPDAPADSRILVRPDRLPELRISQFSHMGLLFSPDNPLYGRTGSLRLCQNGQESAAQARCEAGETVWYSDWGYREADKAHARLTFNPYFDWQSATMASVLDAPGAAQLTSQK